VIVEELIKVSKIYPMTNALSKVSLEIREKELLLIRGPSGSGKSTLLNMAGLLDLPSSGKVLINGKPVPTDESERARLRSEVMGFIFQDFGLISSLNTIDNVLLPTIFSGMDYEERAHKLVKILGIEPKIKHYPNQLSGGEKQRVAIARSLVNDPKILFADEPTGNLDSKTGKKVMTMLKGFAKGGKSVVVVSHNPEHEIYADRVVKVKDGEII